MSHYSPSDYLCNEPFYVDGIGHIKCPTLRDIRKVTYQVFTLYLNTVAMTADDFLNLCRAGTQQTQAGMPQNDTPRKEPAELTMYELLLSSSPQLLYGILDFFLTGAVSFNQESNTFDIYETDQEQPRLTGHIHKDNYEAFTAELLCILGLKDSEEKIPRFKNKTAKRMYEKMQRHSTQGKKQSDENFGLDNLIRKYCTHNKVGINILNVWEMTYYQFHTMFNEYCSGRQYDINDMMAANTFSYKKSSDYKAMDYMKK